MAWAGPEITQDALRRRVDGALIADLFGATQLNQQRLDGSALQLFSVRKCSLASVHFREYVHWLFSGTLMQFVMRVAFLSRKAPNHAARDGARALPRLIADRHDRGRLGDALEKNRRCIAALSSHQLVGLGSTLVTLAEWLAESVCYDVDVSLEGTKRLGQKCLRVRRTLNSNDRNRFSGITRPLNRDLDSPVAEPKANNPARHSPVGGGLFCASDVEGAIDLDTTPVEARMIADDFMASCDPS
jgi:hypothetical protein